MATHVTRMPIFKGSTSESWTSYAERLEFFFKGNKITEDEQKHALLLSSFEPSTFELIKSLVQPATVESKSYSDVVTTHNRQRSYAATASIAGLGNLASRCQLLSPSYAA